MPLDWSQALAFEAFIGVAKALGILPRPPLECRKVALFSIFTLFGLPTRRLAAPYAIIRVPVTLRSR